MNKKLELEDIVDDEITILEVPDEMRIYRSDFSLKHKEFIGYAKDLMKEYVSTDNSHT